MSRLKRRYLDIDLNNDLLLARLPEAYAPFDPIVDGVIRSH